MAARFNYWEEGGSYADDDNPSTFESLLGRRDMSSSQSSSNYTGFYNDTSAGDDFVNKLVPATDVSVDAVLTSIYLNVIVFCVLMATYECLRRLLPAVYSSEMKRQFKDQDYLDETESDITVGAGEPPRSPSRGGAAAGGAGKPSNNDPFGDFERMQREASHASLPDVLSSFNWVSSVNSVSWIKVRKIAGLDGYFFLRYIRMNVRICSITAFWAFLVLVPVYGTGDQTDQEGWYHISAANVAKGSWRMWVPCVFAYLLSGFIFFVMKQEYRHFLDIRMDFLARGTSHVHPQHHYSLKIENVPYELRSEKALYDYFDKLFPGKVHSTSVVLNLPDLEYVKNRCLRVCRRLEKSIAFSHAVGKRATHNVGSPRISILGVEMAPFDWSCGQYPEVAFVDTRVDNQKPERGTHVDSISYYTHDLAALNKDMYFMQQRKTEIQVTGNVSFEAHNWISRVMMSAYEVADSIMVDSAEDNALKANYSSFESATGAVPQAEQMRSRYGSFGTIGGTMNSRASHSSHFRKLNRHESPLLDTKGTPVAEGPPVSRSESTESSRRRAPQALLNGNDGIMSNSSHDTLPGTTYHRKRIRRVAGRLGLDFVVTGIKFFNRQLDHALESVVGATMSSTGFVTFLDLTSVTCAAATPLTSKPQILDVSIAPEARDIIWENAHVSAKACARNVRTVNVVLFFGVFFWIFPLAAIQAFANAEYIAQIPGMEWILTFDGGSLSAFVNGYMPVVAFLVLVLMLPLIFEFVALKYERRKTYSEVQKSMLSRYFYYQLVNIYITVTAGSLWGSLAEILDHPSSLVELLGESLPSMVGYFIALLVTKILAGLPLVFIRVGALFRMLLYRAISARGKLTQRELDQIYRPENVQYGWEFPSQLLVIVIVFTYAVICPIILPVGLLYFCGSLIVYKKQVLYVYQPVYESGGAMFPSALQRTLFGLVCGQLTLIGYLVTRQFYYQPIFLLPLPVVTIWGMGYFHQHYAKPSERLSLERAREYDRVSEVLAAARAARGREEGLQQDDLEPSLSAHGLEARRAQFDKNSYRQPVLTQKPMVPRRYRRGQEDPLTEECRQQVKQVQDYSLMNEDGIPHPISDQRLSRDSQDRMGTSSSTGAMTDNSGVSNTESRLGDSQRDLEV